MDGYDSPIYQYQEYDAYCDYLERMGIEQIYGFYGQRLNDKRAEDESVSVPV